MHALRIYVWPARLRGCCVTLRTQDARPACADAGDEALPLSLQGCICCPHGAGWHMPPARPPPPSRTQVAEKVNALARGKPGNTAGPEEEAVVIESGQLR